MNPYIEKLKPYLLEKEQNIHAATVQDAVWSCYYELHPVDTEEVSHLFHQLDNVLDKLSLREYDRVWNLTCQLCSAHEQSAFLEGIRMGIQLVTEDWKS